MPATAHPPATAARAHVLDRLIGAELPRFDSPDEIAAFEAQAPWHERVAAASTWEALQLGACIDPQAPAIVFLPHADPDEAAQTWSHAEFIAKATQAANLFHRLGVGAGGVVSLLLPLLPQTFAALFGAQAVGVANPVNHLLSPAQIAEILEAAETQVLVCAGPEVDPEIWAKVQAIRGELKHLKALVVVGGAGLPPDALSSRDTDDFDTLIARQPATHLLSGRTPAATDIAGYFHTGGTTGTPKLVQHSHANEVYQAWALRLMHLAAPRRALLFGLPLFHVGGSLTGALSVLANGGHLVVLSPLGWRNPQAVRHCWKLVQRFRPMVLSAVPTVLGAVLQIPVAGCDISSLQRAGAGGSAIPIAVIQAYERDFHLPVLEVYGMTETASIHTMVYPHLPRTPGCTGRPLPYSRVRIVKVGADGSAAGDCGPDEIGVVAMAGPGVFAGYRSQKHNQGAFFAPGWVNSGDLGRLDAQGGLWITGRAKDLIIRGGHNIDPAPLEELLYQHPSVGLAALVGQPDAYAGELPVAYVQPRLGATVDTAELIGWLKERTPERAAVPVALHVIDAMPLTAVGKIFKPALRVDAAARVARKLVGEALAVLGVGEAGFGVQVVADATHGQVIEVALQAQGEARAVQAAAVQQALGPLTLRHRVV